MHRSKLPLIVCLASLALDVATGLAEEVPHPSPIEPPPPGMLAKPSPQPRVFRNVPVKEALRQLARAGKINILIGDGVSGSITIRTGEVPPLEAIRMIVQARQLSLIRGEGAVYFVRTAKERAQELKLRDPALMRAFVRLVEAKAPKSEFDKLPCAQRRVKGWLELNNFAFVPGDLKICHRAMSEVRTAKAVVVYRVHYTWVSAVFFGDDLRPRFEYGTRAAGIGLP